jgi:hypothetical protein
MGHMMTIQEFNSLSVAQKTKLVQRNGRQLFTHRETDVNSFFYRLGDFNVEVWFDNKRNQVLDIQPFPRLIPPEQQPD